MERLDDVARFRPVDDGAVVAASFACPLCLRRASWVLLVSDDAGGSAGCRCISCDVPWLVFMQRDQLLRMRLAPPPGLLVSNAAPRAHADDASVQDEQIYFEHGGGE